MAESPAALATLPAGFENLPVEEAVRTLLQSVIQHHDAYFELRVRHGVLVEWVKQE